MKEECFSLHQCNVCFQLFQNRQPIFVDLLRAAFRVSRECDLSVDQRCNVEGCIRTLSESAKNRAIAIPVDLDVQVKPMFDKANVISMKTGVKWFNYSKLKREPSTVSDAFSRKISCHEYSFFLPPLNSKL